MTTGRINQIAIVECVTQPDPETRRRQGRERCKQQAFTFGSQGFGFGRRGDESFLNRPRPVPLAFALFSFAACVPITGAGS